MNTWLLTWEGIEDNALLDNDNKIVTILSGRTALKSIELIVDVLYTRCVWTAGDLSYFANRRKEREKRFNKTRHGLHPRIFYGDIPRIFIYARKVTDLVVERDENQQLERVRWTDHPYLIQNSEYNKFIEKEPATPQQLTRALKPVSAEIYPRTEQSGEGSKLK